MTRTNLLSCLIKGDLISRFDFDFSKTDVQSWVASQHNKVRNILCQQLATFNWLQHQFLAKKKVSQLCPRMLISQSFNFPIFSGEHAHKHFWGVCCKATCLTGWFQYDKERIPDVHHRHFYHIKQFTSCFVPLENTLFNFSNMSILRQHFKFKFPFSNCPLI